MEMVEEERQYCEKCGKVIWNKNYYPPVGLDICKCPYDFPLTKKSSIWKFCPHCGRELK